MRRACRRIVDADHQLTRASVKVIAVSNSAVGLNPRLLEILACPKDKGSLIYYEDEQVLYNPRLQMCYEIRHGIPVMLIGEAKTVNQLEHERLAAKAKQLGLKPTF